MKILKLFLGRKITYPLWKRLYRVSLYGMNVGGGGTVFESGEVNVFRYIRHKFKNRGIILYDVGANYGNYAMEAMQVLGEDSVKIRCFEPGRSTYHKLIENMHSYSNIDCYNFGLSDKEDRAILYYDKPGSGLASLYNRQLDYFGIDFSEQEKVHLRTLDDFYQSMKLNETIHLLKLDVEGNEIKVLKGAKNLLAAKKIEMIQIEFGGANIDSRTFLRDFWNLLHKDYKMYRILNDGFAEIPFYTELIENFSCTNYLFILK